MFARYTMSRSRVNIRPDFLGSESLPTLTKEQTGKKLAVQTSRKEALLKPVRKSFKTQAEFSPKLKSDMQTPRNGPQNLTNQTTNKEILIRHSKSQLTLLSD